MVKKKNKKNNKNKTKSVKSSSSISFLTRKINFKSKKVQLLTVVSAFALIGGGFMVYKSFAATNSFLYNYDNGYMRPYKNANVEKETQKGNFSVVRLRASSGEALVGYPASMPYTPSGQNMRYCIIYAYVVAGRTSKPGTNVIEISQGGTTKYVLYNSSQAIGHDYVEKCTSWSIPKWDVSGYIYVKNKSLFDVKVSALRMEWSGDVVKTNTDNPAKNN